MTLVSVFIPVYNTEKYISQAIKSIIKQTYKEWELIILDDCSTDNTFNIISEYSKKDSRIKVFRNKKNIGMMPNWNEGLKLCKGKYWGKLDADDYWAPTVIENSLNILEKDEKVGLVCGKYLLIDERENLIKSPELPEFAVNKSFNCINIVSLGPKKMFQYNVLRQGIGLMRRSVFDDLGFFTLLDNGDTEMWFRIGCHHEIHCIDKVLHYHRIWSESFMRTNCDKNLFRAKKNFFDVRNVILSYYFKQKKLSVKNYNKFLKENKFIFNSYLISKNRKKLKYIKMLKLLFVNFSINFGLTLKDNLHILRPFKRA